MSLLQRLKHRFFPPPLSPLGKLLVDYPPFYIPFPGRPEAISAAQAQANLEALLAQRHNSKWVTSFTFTQRKSSDCNCNNRRSCRFEN